jgi:hypothetical protein
MTIYTSSKKLKIDLDTEVKLLTYSNIDLVGEDDIIISTGTVRDDLIVRILVDREVLPFIITFTDSTSVSSFLENLSLVVNKKIRKITASLVEQIKGIKDAIMGFENYSKSFFKKRAEIEVLALYQQFLLLDFYNKAGFKSEEEPKSSRRDIYFSNSHRGESLFIILHNDKSLRVFEIKRELSENDKEFIYNMINKHFEALMKGERIELRNRRFSFEYQEITQRYKKEYLLIGIDDDSNFSNYALYNIKSPKSVQNMVIYQTNNDITPIDEKGELALLSLRNIIKHTKENPVKLYKNLDTFLFSAHNFKSIIESIDYSEQDSFKQTVISDMFEKIYNNIKKEDRGTSLLRFALVSLLSDEFDSFGRNISSHIFYDIHNGININAQLIKNMKKEQQTQKKTLDEPNMIDEHQKELFNAFLEENQNKKFIKVFLYTLLNMTADDKLDRKKSIRFISFITYMLTEENPKITKRDGVDKIQIEHCFMVMVLFLIDFNVNRFFLFIDEYFDMQESLTIKEFMEKEYSHTCKGDNKEIEIIYANSTFKITKTSLRTINSRFLVELVKVGLFYKLISGQSSIDDIIAISFQRIRDGRVDIKELCQESITFKFLSLFFEGHRKKDCLVNLKSFLEESQILLKESS